MKRYGLCPVARGKTLDHELQELERGEWVRHEDAVRVNAECERYAGKLEAALEAIRVVCRLANCSQNDSYDVFDTIALLTKVKDDRGAI